MYMCITYHGKAVERKEVEKRRCLFLYCFV